MHFARSPSYSILTAVFNNKVERSCQTKKALKEIFSMLCTPLTIRDTKRLSKLYFQVPMLPAFLIINFN